MSSFRLLQISDTHFGTEVDVIAHALSAKIRELNPDLVVLTGDITQRARPSQFKKAKLFLESFLPIPVICCPGNHDIPLFNLFSRFVSPYGNYLGGLNKSLEDFYTNSTFELLVLNSTSPFHHINGILNRDELDRQLVRFSPTARWKVVALHHPFDCRQKIDEKNILINSIEVMESCSRAGVDLIMGGHIHDPFVNSSVQRYPRLPKNIILSVCGTSVSHRIRRRIPNSFTYYHFSDDQKRVLIQRHDFDPQLIQFGVVNEQSYDC